LEAGYLPAVLTRSPKTHPHRLPGALPADAVAHRPGRPARGFEVKHDGSRFISRRDGEGAPVPRARVINLMDALRRSIEGEQFKKPAAAASKRRPASRKRA
jgi:hypothetical protein